MEPDGLLDGRLKLRHLVMVTTIAEHGSVVRAAEHLHVTQPVVTRGLRELETILGARMFDRGPRGVELTIYGSAFVEHARAVLAQIRQAGQHVAELGEAKVGTVTVGTHLAGTTVLLPRAIARLKRQRPHVTVVVKDATPDVLHLDLLGGRIDLMVGRLAPPADDARLSQVRLYDEAIRLVTRTGHPAQELPAPSIADLLGYPWILPVRETALRREIENVFFAEGVPLPADRVECTSNPILHTLLTETDAIAAMPMLVAAEDDKLSLLPSTLPSVSRRVGVTLPRDRTPGPTARLLLECLHDAAADIRERLVSG
ncbi:LysR substrate-binding domain-containing protein [Prauserella muralis]|uniref:LysR family transcriptional regulator n=1 Tax=Prauserella muralis TaxID=588067 RepID=A0A2V4APA9_9PSEU|nr:LysR substrate-binding domain-containing protein [Prauserella muralis]PXY22543.1 LysR family transcriptional regulator [Prauserella muralis]TWE28228.1 DNA-binding transcriptional LysR family regulator [Prauserella muralis]